MSNQKQETKPCPFCGSTDLEFQPETLVVLCNGCAAEGPFGGLKPGTNARKIAVSKWNRRRSSTFADRVLSWLTACFGRKTIYSKEERNHRFLEESLELVQTCGCTASEAHQLVDYVFSRPVGEKHQELGGVMVTPAALSLIQGLDMHEAGETELARVWTKIEQIRSKQASKPKHSPLPGQYPQQTKL